MLGTVVECSHGLVPLACMADDLVPWLAVIARHARVQAATVEA